MKYFQIIPEQILEELPAVNELLSEKIPHFKEEYLKEVITIIAVHVKNKDEAAPLKMAFLRKIVPGADRYVKGLMELGMITRTSFYVPGETSYKYDFTPEYRSKYKTVPLKNMKVARRIEQAYKYVRRQNSRSVRGRTEQVPYLKEVTIDPEYREYIERIEDTERYNYYLAAGAMIERGQIFYKIDNTSGRFHSNITNLPEELRRFVKVKKQSLVNIDIKNSQPYLSTVLLTRPGKVSWFANDPDFSMMLESLRVSQNEDVSRYIHLVVTGQIYEYLTEKFAEEDIVLTRKETKGQVLRILFAPNKMPKNPANRKCREIFQREFPTVHEKFNQVRGKQKGDYKRFAILLQKVEAYLMLDVIMKRIHNELPGTIAITIHDSILTGVMTNNAERVAEIIRGELRNFVGAEPQIKIDRPFSNNKEEQRTKKEDKEEEFIEGYYDVGTFVRN
jgi:hypothetical protein